MGVTISLKVHFSCLSKNCTIFLSMLLVRFAILFFCYQVCSLLFVWNSQDPLGYKKANHLIGQYISGAVDIEYLDSLQWDLESSIFFVFDSCHFLIIIVNIVIYYWHLNGETIITNVCPWMSLSENMNTNQHVQK